MHGVSDHAGSTDSCQYDSVVVAFRTEGRRRLPELGIFRSSIPGLHVPLSTLRLDPYGTLRMTRGQRGWLGLHCTALSSAPLCRFIPAHPSPGLRPASPCQGEAEEKHKGAPQLDPLFPSPFQREKVPAGRMREQKRSAGFGQAKRLQILIVWIF